MKRFVLFFVIVLLVLSLSGCGTLINDNKVAKAVEKQGYTEVRLRNKSVIFHSWSGCSDSDSASWDGTAINPIGVKVDIVVCAGWPFKGVTVRTK
jgi:predicted small lipoprotein YifL